MKENRADRKGTFNLGFGISLSLFFLCSVMLGFMIGDMEHMISESSKEIFSRYLMACEMAIIGSLYFVIKFYGRKAWRIE